MHGFWEARMALRIAMLLVLSAVPVLAEEAEEFPLEEASAFDDAGSATADSQFLMFRRQVADNRSMMCATAPLPDVVYPKLRSRAPLYGCLPLTNDPKDQLHFVVDESEPAVESAAESGPSLMSQVADVLTGAAPATPDVKRKYDVLYADINGDRDLTNDTPLRPMKEPPKAMANAATRNSVVVFDYLEIKRGDEGAAAGRPVRVLPWLNLARAQYPGFQVSGAQQAYLVVTSPTVRTGRIRIGETWYQAMLGVPMQGPATRLLVQPESAAVAESSRRVRWQQMALGRHQAAGGFFDVTASPSGDKIMVAPYRGPMGELRVDPGDREVEQFGAAGVLVTSTGSPAWIGEPGNYYSTERPRSCTLPVGDYRLNNMTVECGDVLVNLSANSRRMQVPGNASSAAAAFPIAIREDQPFVLRFSDQPTMTFVSPPENANQVFRRGTQISIQAMLLDPALDCLIRGLNDKSQKLQERTYATEGGETRSMPVYASLIPQVSITNAAGKEVASGVMPFG